MKVIWGLIYAAFSVFHSQLTLLSKAWGAGVLFFFNWWWQLSIIEKPWKESEKKISQSAYCLPAGLVLGETVHDPEEI